MASVKKITNGNGEVRYRARWRDPDGKSRERAFRKKGDADRFAASMTADVARGDYLAPDAGRVLFSDLAATWLAAQAFDPNTRQAVEQRLRLHVLPTLGGLRVADIRPSTVQGLIAVLSQRLAPTTVRQCLITLGAILSSAVEDGLLRSNPAKAKSVRAPKPDSRKVEPWPVEQVRNVHDALPERYRIVVRLAAGLGLRQGEVFGLATSDVDFLRGIVTVQRQVKIIGSRLVFALPKGRKVRTVPLPTGVRDDLAAYLAQFPAQAVTLPWGDVDGDPVTAPLILTSRERKAMNRNYLNSKVWKVALTSVGVDDSRSNGMHALRHHYASVLLDGGVSIRALSDYLGHSDPGFTLRIYTHLMPATEDRTRDAVDISWGSRGVGVGSEPAGTGFAQVSGGAHDVVP